MSKFEAKILSGKKMVRINTLEGEQMLIYGDRKRIPKALINIAKEKRCLAKVCQAYLAYVVIGKSFQRRH